VIIKTLTDLFGLIALVSFLVFLASKVLDYLIGEIYVFYEWIVLTKVISRLVAIISVILYMVLSNSQRL